MAKRTPGKGDKFDPKGIQKLKAQKANDKLEGELNRRQGRDTRMSRDGGTSRRTRQ